MPALYPQVPSARQRQIRRILWASLALSFCGLGASLVSLGSYSLWIATIAFLFTIIHNVTLLILSRAGRKAPARPMPFIATMGTIICASLCAILLVAAFGRVLFIFVKFGIIGKDVPVIAISCVEWVLELGEAVLVVVFVTKCIQERKAIKGAVGDVESRKSHDSVSTIVGSLEAASKEINDTDKTIFDAEKVLVASK